MRFIGVVLLSVIQSGCASLPSINRSTERALIGAGIGGAAGATGGALLSPNDESRGMNALVFGLSGALTGAVTALVLKSGEEPKDTAPTLKEMELGESGASRQYVVYPQQQLPGFLKERLQPIVVEEYTETDMIGQDGTLHEPHKVYRIKQPGELFSRPIIEKKKETAQ